MHPPFEIPGPAHLAWRNAAVAVAQSERVAVVRELCAKGLAAAAGVQLRAHTVEMLGAVLELKLLPSMTKISILQLAPRQGLQGSKH